MGEDEREVAVPTHNHIEQGLPETVSLLDKLRMAIYHGEFMPGRPLVESELAARYDTSRGAVREALVQLENEGLILRPRNRSASVRPVTPEEAVEITEVRAVIEGLCAAKAAAAATEADHAELRALMREMGDAVKRGDMLADSRISDLMHAKIRQIGGQGTANRILERLRYQDVRYQFHVSMLPGRLVKGANEHFDIIEAVIAGDAVAAEQLTRDHFLSVIAALRQLEELKQQHPGIAL
jgi:DNA-binding GntR family transcriptional regulator